MADRSSFTLIESQPGIFSEYNTIATTLKTQPGSETVFPVNNQITKDQVTFDSGLLAGQIRDQNLYLKDFGSIELKPAYDLTQIVTDTEISHIDPANTLLKRHLDLFNQLRTSIGNDDEETGLHKKLQAFIEKWQNDNQVSSVLSRYFSQNDTNNGITITRTTDPINESAVKKTDDNDSSALFNLSRFAMDDFHRMSSLRRDFNRLKKLKTQAMRSSLKKRAQLEREIQQTREAFDSQEKNRLETQENYAIVQGLLEQQLQAVDDAFVQRHKILSNLLGLCFVRVSDVPVQMQFHQTPLIPQPQPGQLPAQCQTAPELPERLDAFLELLGDLPMRNWRVLQQDWRWLPELNKLPQRIQPVVPVYQRIAAMPIAFQPLIKALPQVNSQPEKIVSVSLATGRKQLAEHVTLSQLMLGRQARLRKKAHHLQENLAQALSCLLEQLIQIPADDRFAWSRLAENDTLNTENPLSWPDFNHYASRREGLLIRELVAWFYAQLAENASHQARTALRTAIRACVLQSVNDDPEDLLHGDVVQFPGVIQTGVLMTAVLNRVPVLNAKLKVFDASQQLIAEAVVVDSQEKEASLEIVSAYRATSVAYHTWTVVGHKVLRDDGID